METPKLDAFIDTAQEVHDALGERAWDSATKGVNGFTQSVEEVNAEILENIATTAKWKTALVSVMEFYDKSSKLSGDAADKARIKAAEAAKKAKDSITDLGLMSITAGRDGTEAADEQAAALKKLADEAKKAADDLAKLNAIPVHSAAVAEKHPLASVAVDTHAQDVARREEERHTNDYFAVQLRNIARDHDAQTRAMDRARQAAELAFDRQNGAEEAAIAERIDADKLARANTFHASELAAQTAYDSRRTELERQFDASRTANQIAFQDQELAFEESANTRRENLQAQGDASIAQAVTSQGTAQTGAQYQAAIDAEARARTESKNALAQLDRALDAEKLARSREFAAEENAARIEFDDAKMVRQKQFEASKIASQTAFNEKESVDAHEQAKARELRQVTFDAARQVRQDAYEALRLEAQDRYDSMALRNARIIEDYKDKREQERIYRMQQQTQEAQHDAQNEADRQAQWKRNQASVGVGYANGGDFIVGGSGGTDTTPVRFMATPGERVTISTPAQQANGNTGGSVGSTILNITMNGIQNMSAFVRELEQYTRTNPAALRLRAGLNTTG